MIQSIVDKQQTKLVRIQKRLDAIEHEGKQGGTHDVLLKEVNP
ncbi:hypothetical protein [Paenibacillus sp. 23TSA30-6]|nr:hypothetical protein [Paenibacillus sp. 23TSA30-6]